MNRMKSMELLKLLQPFTQTGILKGSEAQTIVGSYLKNDTEPLKRFLHSPSIPMTMESVVGNIEAFIKGGNQK